MAAKNSFACRSLLFNVEDSKNLALFLEVHFEGKFVVFCANFGGFVIDASTKNLVKSGSIFGQFIFYQFEHSDFLKVNCSQVLVSRTFP